MKVLFILGLLPIILGIFVLSFLVASMAKKRGKNPWFWGSLTVALITMVTWQKLPLWAGNIFYRGKAMTQSSTLSGRVITLADAKRINIRVSVDDIYFDVPLVYDFRGYNQQLHGWQNVSQGQIKGKERRVVDFINIQALLPDIVSVNEENLAQFEKLGWGKRIHASITHMKSWDYYFNNSFKELQRQPDLPEVPSMLHYYDAPGQADMYFSHDRPTDELTRIRCNNEKIFPHPVPTCEVETFYRPASDSVASEHISGAIFYLEYRLPSQYLVQWREIDRKLKSLFDQFVKNAT